MLVAGRGTRVRDDGVARSVAAESPLGAGDGESAAGGTVELGTLPKPTSTTAADGGAVFRPVHKAVTEVVTPVVPAPQVTTPELVAPPTVAPPAAPAEPPAPTATEPAVELTVGIDGVLGLTVGDQCTGLEIAGTVLGCEPLTTGAPLEVITDGTLLNTLGL